jgi:hypothetical protein
MCLIDDAPITAFSKKRFQRLSFIYIVFISFGMPTCNGHVSRHDVSALFLTNIESRCKNRCISVLSAATFQNYLTPKLITTEQAIVFEIISSNSCDDVLEQKPTVVSTISFTKSPRVWLESLPDGAYTAIRCEYECEREHECEYIPNATRTNRRLNIWGREYHLQRLHDSSVALMNTFIWHTNESHILPVEDCLTVNDEHQSVRTNVYDIKLARDHTIAIFDEIAKINIVEDTVNVSTFVIMLTILWYASKNEGKVNVRGHASVVSSIESIATETNSYSRYLSTIPMWNLVINSKNSTTVSRQNYPQPYAKVSSWCKQRKPLEKLFMPQSKLSQTSHKMLIQDTIHPTPVSIHEIILTRTKMPTAVETETNGIHLLEGLTSNLFVVYPNNVIRTAGSGVLFGYVRHLVIFAVTMMQEHSTSNGSPWTIDTSTPIRLDEVNEWQEVFCTSSIRLIIPIERIFVPVDCDKNNQSNRTNNIVETNCTINTNGTVEELWRCTLDPQKQVWKLLTRSIIKNSID